MAEEITRHWYEPRESGPDKWCRYCNLTLAEHERYWPDTDKITFADFVASHGQGDPTEEGYRVGLELTRDGDYAKAAYEVVFRGLVKE